MKRVLQCFASLLLAAGALAAGNHLAETSLQAEVIPETMLAPGLRVDGVSVPDAELDQWVAARAARVLDRRITVKDGGAVLFETSLRELGGSSEIEAATLAAWRIGHEGSMQARVLEARQAATFDVPLRYELPVDELAARVLDRKGESDTRPKNARRIVSADGDRLIDHRDGSYIDVFATADVLLAAAKQPCDAEASCGGVVTDVKRLTWEPRATTASLSAANVSTNVGAFETKFGGAPGRNKNIERGAAQLDGVVIMPGETISFNELVGPRTTDNGFFPAPEIYKGEMREGIGGGACQVASTVYAAAFYAGLTVEERRNHSRPSAYIRSGLDATVSYPVLDLRIKNPFDFPILLSAKADRGVMRAEFFGQKREVNVTLATQTKAILKYSRKLERSGFLPAGEFRLKQKGKRGLSIARKKTLEHLTTGLVTVEESVDIYPPTQEIVLVAPGLKEADLPPLEPPSP